MLDDENVLNQFYVRAYLETYLENLSSLPDKLSPFSLKSSSRAQVKQIFFLEESPSLLAKFFQDWLGGIETPLSSPVNLVSNLQTTWLSKNSLVCITSSWHDDNRRRKLIKLAEQAQARVVDLGADGLNIIKILSLLVKLKVVSEKTYNDWRDVIISEAGRAKKLYSPSRSLDKNLAKQTALFMVGKSVVLTTTSPNRIMTEAFVYRLRTVANNLAFNEDLHEQISDGWLGWTSHPVEKPYATFVLDYNFTSAENDLVLQRAKILSGLMPASRTITIKADNFFAACVQTDLLAHFVAAYLAALNKRSLSTLIYGDQN